MARRWVDLVPHPASRALLCRGAFAAAAISRRDYARLGSRNLHHGHRCGLGCLRLGRSRVETNGSRASRGVRFGRRLRTRSRHRSRTLEFWSTRRRGGSSSRITRAHHGRAHRARATSRARGRHRRDDHSQQQERVHDTRPIRATTLSEPTSSSRDVVDKSRRARV